MLIVEFRVDSPILRATLEREPALTITYEEQYYVDETIRFLFWVEGEDLSTIEEALESDPTVTEPVLLTETASRRLYRVIYTDYGKSVSTIPMLGTFDIVLLDARARGDGWWVQMRMPDRETLRQYRMGCRNRGLSFQIEAIYHESENDSASKTSLTDSQYEALIAAYDAGYFDVPRSAQLGDVASRLDISAQSLSERLRRGTGSLIDATLREP